MNALLPAELSAKPVIEKRSDYLFINPDSAGLQASWSISRRNGRASCSTCQ